jgi:DNA modification methylase
VTASSYLNKCHFGDVRDVLRRMITDGVKVQTIVTSPPYWGLRSYLPAGHPAKVNEIGSEPTLREFLDTMVGVFALCREVLADDGTMWVNMGDSYAAGGQGSGARDCKQDSNRGTLRLDRPRKATDGFKPKDLMMQPHRLAIALQDDGWYVRQDIVWSKPNPMPESTRDRCTKAHEYVFLLSKKERYYYDFDAVQEPVDGGAHARRAGPNAMRGQGSNRPEGGGRANREGRDMATVGTIKMPDGWNTKPGAHGSFHPEGREKGKTHLPGNVNPPKGQIAYEAGDEKQRTKAGLLAFAEKTRKLAEAGSGTKNNESMDEALAEMRDTRNRRSVWTVASEPYKGAHFATFPTKLIEHPILAGAPAGGIVLDIFMGSGTTAQVAEQLGRQWIGIDIDERNAALQAERLRQPSLALEAA